MGQRIERNKKRKNKQNEIMKIIILFFLMGTTTVIGSASLAFNMLSNSKAQSIQPIKNNSHVENSEQTDNSNQKKVHINVDNENKSDDVAYLERYLGQQVLGQMPDDADGKKIVYLTFDDGPSTTVTPYILNILKRENVKATFFVVGNAIDANDESKNILKREFNEGHAIGNHTYSHNYDYLYPGRSISMNNFLSDINKTNASLKNVLGDNFSTRLIRFPGGYTSWNDDEQVGQYLNDIGYYYIDWNALSKDSEGTVKSADELIYEIKSSVQGREKAVILMHDNYGKEETAKALPEIISYLKSEGYEFRTIE